MMDARPIPGMFPSALFMIIYPRRHWFRLLFVWRGSVLPHILSRLCLVLAISVASVLLNDWWETRHAQSSLNIYIFTLMGVSLAIFLGFRNSASYDRFWEARKLWGVVVIASRTFSGKLLALLGDQADTRVLMDGVCAFAYALKGQLRRDDVHHHLARLLPEAQYQQLVDSPCQPLLILGELQRRTAALCQSGQINDWQWQALDRQLDSLSDALGGCERISGTPIPFTYRVLLNRTVTIYCMLLPLGLSVSIGWLTPVIAVFIAYTYLALDVLGEELEEPFGKEGNDLPLSALCHAIESSVRALRGESMPLPAPQPQGVYLF